MLEGELDIVLNFDVQFFADVEHASNFDFVGDITPTFNYTAFNLGVWDAETSMIVPHENPRMGDVRLRRAMALAVNEEALAWGLYDGLRVPATTIIPPSHARFMNMEMTGFAYDPDQARALLDEAGFTVGPDGWRTFPDGSELIIHYVIGIGADQDIKAQFYAQAWRDVGLNIYVDMRDLALDMAPNLFNADNWPWVDVFNAAWQAGFDPNPNALWGNTISNRPRFMNDTFEQHLAGFNSPQAWDTDWLIQHYHEWQELFYEYVPTFPTLWRIGLTAVNNRVVGFYHTQLFDDGHRTRGGYHRIALTAHVPYRQ